MFVDDYMFDTVASHVILPDFDSELRRMGLVGDTTIDRSKSVVGNSYLKEVT